MTCPTPLDEAWGAYAEHVLPGDAPSKPSRWGKIPDAFTFVRRIFGEPGPAGLVETERDAKDRP